MPGGTVRVWITALERNHPVNDLKKEDLELSIGKQGQPISSLVFNPPVPFYVGLLIDASGSRRAGWPGPELNLASNFFRQVLRQDDLAFVVDFNDTAHLDIDPTGDQAALKHGLERVAALRPYSGTALYDAIEASCGLPKDGEKLHGALVVVTDGWDNASRYGLEQAVDAARRTGTALYFIRTVVDLAQQQLLVNQEIRDAVGRMRYAARATGGMFFKVSKTPDMGQAFDSLAEILHARYAIDFQPTVSSEKKRRIKLKCMRPGVRIVAPEDY